MDLKDIDVSSLRSALEQCKNSIDYSKTESLNSTLSGTNAWKSGAKANLTTAMDTLVNQRYRSLKEKLDSYLNVTSLIEDYQQAVEAKETLTNNNKQLQNNLYKDKDKKEIDTNVQSQISNNNQKINQQADRIKSLEAQINSMV